MDNENRAPVHLLWTSGWDSTFQLLRLLLVHRHAVRPIYLVDKNRRSLQIELRTMECIRERLAERYPNTRALLLPTLYAEVSDLHPDAEIKDAFGRLKRDYPLGTQYEWLARFCRQRQLSGLEIGFERERYGAGALLLDAVVEGTSPAGYRVFRLPPAHRGTDAWTIFGSYVFPLFGYSKQDMAREVDARGWRPVMHLTWFCHRPVGSKPCARCNPCLSVIKGGLGWRIPKHRRVLGAMHRATIGRMKDMLRPVAHRLRGVTPATSAAS